MDKFWSPEAGALDAPRIHPPPRCCLQMAHFCRGLAVFSSKQHFSQSTFILEEVVRCWKINGAAWLQLISNGKGASKHKRSAADSSQVKGWTFIFTVNHHVTVTCVHKTFSENLYIYFSVRKKYLQSPLFPGWNLRHVTWYMARGCEHQVEGGDLHLHENPLNSTISKFHNSTIPLHPDQWWIRHSSTCTKIHSIPQFPSSPSRSVVNKTA